MQVRWTPAAADDLENIANYLFEKTPENAARLIRDIYGAPAILQKFPNRGRAGKKEGTRELLMPTLPYVIVYHVRANIVHIVRILHGSQQSAMTQFLAIGWPAAQSHSCANTQQSARSDQICAPFQSPLTPVESPAHLQKDS